MGGGAETSLFLAAFLAGVAEGNSVLKYYHNCYSSYQSSSSTQSSASSSSSSSASISNRNSKKSPSSSASSTSSSFLIPSVIYGGVAFPMSLIGESPGPELLVACIPSVRKILVPILLDQNLANDINNKSNKSGSNNNNKVPRLHNKDYNSQQPSKQENNVITGEATSKSMIDFARIANRGQKTTITNQSNLWSSSSPPPPPPAAASSGIISNNHSKSISNPSWSRYAATLDSRYSTVLPTPKAELLRRVRSILFGAGLVSTYITHHILKQSTTSNTKEGSSSSKQILNKSIGPLDRFFIHPAKKITNNNNNYGEDGITLRLLYGDDMIGSINSQLFSTNRRIPTLLSSARSSPPSLLQSHSPLVYLNIEDLEHYSDETWLHHYSTTSRNKQQNKTDGNNTFWLIEIDLSPPLKDMFGPSPSSSLSHPNKHNKKENYDVNTDPSSFVLDECRLVMDYIAMMTTFGSSRQNPKTDDNNPPDVIATALYSSSSNYDIQTNTTTKDKELDGQKKIIYVDILKELANKIDQTLCALYQVPKEESNDCNHDDKTESTKSDTTMPKAATLKPTRKIRDSNMTHQMNLAKSTAATDALRNGRNHNGNHDSESDNIVEKKKGNDVFQWIGICIRKAFAALVSSRTSAKRSLPLHVISDNPDFVRWVVECMPNYYVIWTDPNSGTTKQQHGNKQKVRKEEEEEEKDGIPYLICCSTDEKSSRIIQQILTERDNEQTTQALVILERNWTKTVTQHCVDIMAPSNNMNTIEIISMDNLRMDTFKHMQTFLKSGVA